jgi:transcriptional regulator with XRE-family HTH domain
VRIYIFDGERYVLDREALREQIGTLDRAARRLGVSHQAISHYLSGAAWPRPERAEILWRAHPLAFRRVEIC